MPEPSNAKLAGSGTAPATLGFFYRLRQLEGRTRQQLPAAVLFLPDLQDADLGVGDFAVEFAFRHPRGGRVVAVAGDPEDRAVFYFGACAGGVWKTVVGGIDWRCVSAGVFGLLA